MKDNETKLTYYCLDTEHKEYRYQCVKCLNFYQSRFNNFCSSCGLKVVSIQNPFSIFKKELKKKT